MTHHSQLEVEGPIAQMRLERTPDKREVGSSTLPRPTKTIKNLKLRITNWSFEAEQAKVVSIRNY